MNLFKKAILAFGILILFTLQKTLGQNNDLDIYYNISITNEIEYLSDGTVRNFAVKAIDENMPGRFERSFDKDAPLRARFIFLGNTVPSTSGSDLGFTYSIYFLVTEYPGTNIEGIYYDRLAAGQGGKFEAGSMIKEHTNLIVAGVFGRMDENLDIIYKILDIKRE